MIEEVFTIGESISEIYFNNNIYDGPREAATIQNTVMNMVLSEA